MVPDQLLENSKKYSPFFEYFRIEGKEVESKQTTFFDWRENDEKKVQI